MDATTFPSQQPRVTPEQARSATTQPRSKSTQPRRSWRTKVRNAVLGVAAAATIAVGGAGMLSNQDAAEAGVVHQNYAVLTQTVQVPQVSTSTRNDE